MYRTNSRRETDTVSAFIAIVVVLALFLGLGRGIFVSTAKAEQVAQVQLGADVELGNKNIFFVGMRGCDGEKDAAVFKVLPYTNSDGLFVDNAIVCAGWPFKGYTVRFK